MKTAAAVKHFGSRHAIAKALQAAGIEIADEAPYNWGETVPELRQLQLEAITGGRLKAAAGIIPKAAARA